MENFSFQYPSWWLLIGLLIAVLFAGLLYWRTAKWDNKNAWLKPLLWILRGLSVLSIIALLLGPMLKTLLEESKDPTIVMLIDDSKSMSEWASKEEIELNEAFSSLHQSLSTDYAVDVYHVGNDVQQVSLIDSTAYDDEITNLSNAIEYVSDIYEGENVGAVILASDGIYNEGKNPIYASYKSTSPLYTIAFGDTTQKKDVVVKRVLYNEVAYLNDEMLTQVDIQAYNANNVQVKLTVEREESDGWKSIYTENVVLRGNNAFETRDVQLSMNRTGVNHYRYRVSGVNGEANSANNSKDIYIEVLDARQEIGIIANAPHPDITALKQLLEANKNYSVNTFYKNPSAQEIANLDLVILHNLPSNKRPITGVVAELDRLKKARMYVVGDQTNLVAFNSTQDLISITASGGSTNKSQASKVTDFGNFTLSDELIQILPDYPPLDAPFGEYATQGNVQTLLEQRIGKIDTDYPLLSFADVDGVKSAYLLGSGIWRWKLFDYAQRESFDVISELLDKSIVYISTKEDKRKFRASMSANVFLENENISFSAELYNNSYELVNEPEVRLVVSNQDGEEFEYTMSKTSTSYALDIGSLQEGRYSYTASTSFNGESFEDVGRFAVRAIQYELFDLQARHGMLYTLSQQHNGKMYYPNQMGDVITDIQVNPNLKPIVYQNTITKSLLDESWLFGLLALFLCAEWFLRRYFGSL